MYHTHSVAKNGSLLVCIFDRDVNNLQQKSFAVGDPVLLTVVKISNGSMVCYFSLLEFIGIVLSSSPNCSVFTIIYFNARLRQKTKILLSFNTKSVSIECSRRCGGDRR